MTSFYIVQSLTAPIATDDKQDGCKFDIPPPPKLGIAFTDVPSEHTVYIFHRYEFEVTYPLIMQTTKVTLILHANETVEVQVENVGEFILRVQPTQLNWDTG